MSEAEEKQVEDNGSAALIDEIIRMSDFTFDRLPMLDIIGDRLTENLSLAFPDLTRSVCEASIVSLDYIPMAQVMEGLPDPVLLAVGAGRPFDGEILLALDRTLLLTSIELMLGGTAKDFDSGKSDPFTAIEKGFGERIARAILAELQRALSVVEQAELLLERVETDPDSAAVAKASSLCARMKYELTMAGHVGVLQVVVPYDALETLRPDLGKVFFGNRGDDNSSWQSQISKQIERAHMDMEVVLAEETFSLQQIMRWQPGDAIDFGIEDGEPAVMVGADEPMFKVSLGKRNNGYIAVQVVEQIKPEDNSEEEPEEDDGSDN